MLPSPAEAERLVLESIAALSAEDCPLAQAHGRALRAPIVADRDLPPFDRVTMDGYALRSTAWAGGRRRFRVAGMQPAGHAPLTLESDDDCLEIATGAVLPVGADCVVPYELTAKDQTAGWIGVPQAPAAGESVHPKGSDHVAGNLIVPAGTRLTARALAVAAACGSATLRVATRPRVAVIATGDELVPVDAPTVAAHQIRQSNDHALRAMLLGQGLASQVERFHLRDVRAEMEATLRKIVAEFDVLLLSGGVSKGKFDFVPATLAALGVVSKVAGVAQRPGKPFWFGVTPRGGPVFALPGNPVSTSVCFARYVRPALERMLGLGPAWPETVALAAETASYPTMTRFLPVRLSSTADGRRTAEIMPCNTSGDFAELAGTDGFVELPARDAPYAAGEGVRLWGWE